MVAVLAALATVSLYRYPVPLHELRRRLPRCVSGLALFGIGVSLFFASHLGTGPWDVLHAGIAKRTGLDVGLVNNLVGIAILPLWIPLRERVGIGTVLNALEIGLVVDFVKPRLPDVSSLALRLAYAVGGLVAISVASGLYIGAGLGTGPRDGIMIGLKRLGISVRAARTLIEIITLVLGLALGGAVGFGTALFLVGIGPLVQIALKRLALPPLTRP